MDIIRKLLLKRKKLITYSIFCIMTGSFMESLAPWVVSWLIDQSVLVSRRQTNIFFLILFLMIGTAFVCGIVSGRIIAKITSDFAADLRNALYRKLQKFSTEQMERFTGGSLLMRLISDVAGLQNALLTLLTTFARSVFLIFFSLAVAASIHAWICAGLIILLPTTGVIALCIVKRALPFFREGLSVYDGLNQMVKENISAIRIVKAFVKEDTQTERFLDESGHMAKVFVKAEQTVLQANPFMAFMMDTFLLVTIWIGCWEYTGNFLSSGQLLLLFTLMGNLMVTFLNMYEAVFSLIMTFPSVERLEEILQGKEETFLPEITAKPWDDEKPISFQHVFFQYKEKKTLSDISISVRQGEVIGITGTTGSGKSTFVQMISGLHHAFGGQVFICGKEIRNWEPDALRKQIGFVPQKSVLFTGTIRENLKWGNPDATDEMLDSAAWAACAEEFIRTRPEGYDWQVSQAGGNLSGGQRQRLCIARALLKNPKILILDEATSAVDVFLEQKIIERVRKELPDTTIFIVSQRIRQMKNCNRILVFDQGRICGQGSHEQLLKENLIYQDIARYSFAGGDFDADSL